MKNKKAALIILLVSIALQLMFPCGFIAEKEKILSDGTEYKFLLHSIDVMDDSIALYFRTSLTDDNSRYAVFTENSEGLQIFKEFKTEKPKSGVYIKSASARAYVSPLSRYPLDISSYSNIYHQIYVLEMQKRYFYCTAKLLNGKAIISGVFLDDGTPIEQLLKV